MILKPLYFTINVVSLVYWWVYDRLLESILSVLSVFPSVMLTLNPLGGNSPSKRVAGCDSTNQDGEGGVYLLKTWYSVPEGVPGPGSQWRRWWKFWESIRRFTGAGRETKTVGASQHKLSINKENNVHEHTWQVMTAAWGCALSYQTLKNEWSLTWTQLLNQTEEQKHRDHLFVTTVPSPPPNSATSYHQKLQKYIQNQQGCEKRVQWQSFLYLHFCI